jgi:hypothetical protein
MELPALGHGTAHATSAHVKALDAMPDLDESRETERSNDVLATSDDFAAQLAAVVFEWWLGHARSAHSASRERSPSRVLWMSRNTRRTDVTS